MNVMNITDIKKYIPHRYPFLLMEEGAKKKRKK